MLKDVTIGQFFPGKSPIHRLDPRVKLVLVLALIVALFLADGVISYALMIGFLLAIIRISKIPFKMVVRGLKPILFIISFTAVLNLFYTPGDYIWQWGFLHISKQGVFVAIQMVLRIMLLIIGTSMLTYTTSPIQLTDGLERLLSPLKRFHAPVHELSMMMGIALRFLPQFIIELQTIYRAQVSRGAQFKDGKLSMVRSLTIPLFTSAFRHAETLSLAMDARCYHGAEGRSRLKPLSYSALDRNAVSVLIFMLLCVMSANFIPQTF